MVAFTKLIAVVGALMAVPTVIAGQASYYFQYGVAGSCGEYHSDWDFIVAMPPGSGWRCGQEIHIQNTGGGERNSGVGNVQVARIVDTCPGCAPGRIDLSAGLFQALHGGGQADMEWDGVFNVDWYLI